MKRLPASQATGTGPAPPQADDEGLAPRRNDVPYLSAYAAAAREIFVKANGLRVYYRTYYKFAGKAGWGAGSRIDDLDQAVWRTGLARDAA